MSCILMNFGGEVDYFYEKFTTPKAKSLIIGDSRSFQGIQPKEINEYFKTTDLELPMLNYSFTIAQAIIGPLYNESIYKKLDPSTKNGLFIISITPEMLTEHKGFSHRDGEFREAGQPPHNMQFVNMNPNFEYLFKNIRFFHFKGMFRQNSKTHKDGWLEETNLPSNKEVFESWKEVQIHLFLEDAKKSKISQLRVQSLNHLIQRLKKQGHVFLLRMPISKEFYAYEEQYFPEFDRIMDSTANTNHITYINFKNHDAVYKTYDGHHLDKFSGKQFTNDLSHLINRYIYNPAAQ